MFDWLRRYKWLVCLSLIFFIFGIPLIIHILFKFDSKIILLQAEWTAGDLLEYHGAILSFIGTVVLGALALYQNKLIKEESDAKNVIKEKREYEENMPKFVVSPSMCNGNCANLRFEIKNISNNFSSDIILLDIRILSSDGSVFWESEQRFEQSAIQPNNIMEVNLKNPSINEDGYIFMIYMQCKDKYNEVHNYMIKGIYYVKNSFPDLSITEI